MKKTIIILFASAILFVSGCRREKIPEPPPNIVIILIDALRADSLHDYGNSRKTNPFLEEFGKKGIRFAHAYSHSSHTKISTASLFTGLIPPMHAVRRAALPLDRDKARYYSDSLSSRLTTLPEIFEKGGYRTAAFVSNPHIRRFFGFSQGFSSFQYFTWPRIRAKSINASVLQWLKRNGDHPFFLYIHYMDVHAPYNPPLPYRFLYTEKKIFPPVERDGPFQKEISPERIQYTRDRYEGQINYWDVCFKDLMQKMKGGGWRDNTLFIILSDHGDEFYEHGGFGHGYTLYEEQLHIPLYFIQEGRIAPGQVFHDPVSTIDIFPTICRLGARNIHKLNLPGRDILSKKKREFFHYAEAFHGKIPRSLQTDKHKLIFNSGERTLELYCLAEDPEEKESSPEKDVRTARRLQKKLLDLMSMRIQGIHSIQKELDEETIEQLKSLGYIK